MSDDEKLQQYAKPAAHIGDEERWWFSDPGFTHNRKAALQIIDACLALGVPPDDLMTSESWLRVILRIVALEARMAKLEGD